MPSSFIPEDRASSKVRGYDAQWRKVRAMKLAANPLCEECERANQTTVATMVHHIEPIKGPNDPRRLEMDNLMSLCESCHDSKHSGPGKQLKGCNSAGWPSHPDHPWNLAGGRVH